MVLRCTVRRQGSGYRKQFLGRREEEGGGSVRSEFGDQGFKGQFCHCLGMVIFG